MYESGSGGRIRDSVCQDAGMVGWVFGLGLESQAFGPAFFFKLWVGWVFGLLDGFETPAVGSDRFMYHLLGAVQMDREGPGIDWMLRLVQWNFTKQV